MKVYFMKQKALDMLERDVKENIENYKNKDSWVEEYFIEKEKPNYFFDTGIEVPDFNLVIGGPETDFENSKIIYEAFSKHINPIQAGDLRLWAYLAHVTNWKYMNERWTIDVPNEKSEENIKKTTDRIRSRYFFGSSKGKAFVRQGMSRLYWSAYLTYDEDNSNPYEYTEYFFSKQDIFTSITERSYARNKVFVLAALKELKKNPGLSREEIRMFLAKLNQVGAITVIDFLDKDSAEEICIKTMQEVIKTATLEEGSKFIAYDESIGRTYGTKLIIKDGSVTVLGKKISTKPRNLIGKKEGTKFKISNNEYVIKNIQ